MDELLVVLDGINGGSFIKTISERKEYITAKRNFLQQLEIKSCFHRSK